MTRTCRTCTGVPAPGFRWCDDCLESWGRGRDLPAIARPTVDAVEPVPARLTLASAPADTDGRQCTNCTGVYPVLVDDVLCIRCDSLLYPTSPVQPSTSTARPVQLREAS